MTESEASAAADEWEVFWASMRQVELTADVEQAAGVLAVRRRLHGAEAVHLASALALGCRDLTVAVGDRRLHAGAVAVAVGLAIAPADVG